MSTTKTAPIQLSPAERRQRVAVGVKAGKSNRAIAKELVSTRERSGGTESTSRRPRTSALSGCQGQRRSGRSGSLAPTKRRQRHQQHMLKVVQLWITQEGLLLPDLDLFVLPKAGKLLHQHRHSLSQLPEPVKSPDELLSLTRPTYAVEEYMPAKLGFYAEWLARWLACCLPREEELQDEVLRQISIRARS